MDVIGNDLKEYILLAKDFMPTTFLDGKPLVNIAYRVSYYNYEGRPYRTVDSYIVNCKVVNDVVWKTHINLTESVVKEIGERWDMEEVWRAACRY